MAKLIENSKKSALAADKAVFERRFRIVETKSTKIHDRHGQTHAAHLFLLRK